MHEHTHYHNKNYQKVIFSIFIVFLLSIIITNNCFAIGKYTFFFPNLFRDTQRLTVSPRVLGSDGAEVISSGIFKLQAYNNQWFVNAETPKEDLLEVKNMLASWEQESYTLAKEYQATNTVLSAKLKDNAMLSKIIKNYIGNLLEQDNIAQTLKFQKLFKTNFSTEITDRALNIMRTEQSELEAEITHIVSEPKNFVNTQLNLEGAIKRAGLSMHIEALYNIAKEDPNLKYMITTAMSDEEEMLLYYIGFVKNIEVCF